MIRSQRDLAEVSQPTHALTQTEKLLLRYEETTDWVRNNQRIVSAAAVVVVAIVVGLWWWAGERKANNDRASTYVSRAMNFYAQGDYRHVIDGDMTHRFSGDPIYGLKYIVREFGSTPSGKLAALPLGNAYYYLGKYDSASAAFDAASNGDPILTASIEAGRAAIFEQRGNKTEAAKLFEQAAARDKDNPLNADYQFAAGRDHESAGEKDQAVKIFYRLLEDYPGTQFDDAALRELMRMNIEL